MTSKSYLSNICCLRIKCTLPCLVFRRSVFCAGVPSCKNILQLSVDGVYPEKSPRAPECRPPIGQCPSQRPLIGWASPPPEYNLSPFQSVAKEYTSTAKKIKQLLHAHSYKTSSHRVLSLSQPQHCCQGTDIYVHMSISEANVQVMGSLWAWVFTSL